jgi:isopentenyl diphosphate isomerase/L-lactate dehydrogenase-like FMN-dependent dehydrogenase
MEPVSLFEYESLAKSRMANDLFDYIQGGVVDEITIGRNRRTLNEVALKALALDARAMQIGRPMFWGLAIDGEAGVLRVLRMLRAEFDRAMAYCGFTSVADIDRSAVTLPDTSR